MYGKTNTERVDQSCVFGKMNDHQTSVGVEVLIDLEGVGDFCPFCPFTGNIYGLHFCIGDSFSVPVVSEQTAVVSHRADRMDVSDSVPDMSLDLSSSNSEIL